MKAITWIPNWARRGIFAGLILVGLAVALPLAKRPVEPPAMVQGESVTAVHGGDDARGGFVPSEAHPEARAPSIDAAPEPSTRPAENVESTPERTALAKEAAQKGAVAEALVKIGSAEALRSWGKAVLQETDPENIRAMMAALDNLNGEAGLEIVTELVELSDRPEVFDGLARTLSRMANSDTPQHLAELSTQPEVVAGQHERALLLLAGISNAEAVPGLARLLHQPDFGTDVSGQASIGLGKIGNPAAVIALAAAFNSLPEERFAARQQAIQALASISNPESAALLSDLAANSTQPLIASAAKDALEKIPAAKIAAADEPKTWLPAPQFLTGKTVR